jgi:hypothetical protein
VDPAPPEAHDGVAPSDGSRREDEEVIVMTEMSEQQHTEHRSDDYEAARKRVERKRKLRADVVAYIVINLGLIGIWALAGFGYFWPGWVLAGWGVALALDAWNALYQRPITNEDVEREMRRTR